MVDINFPYYPANVKIVKPLGSVTLDQFIKANRSPNKNIQNLFIKIQKASALGLMKEKATLKQGLYYFNPCVNTDGLGRSYTNITSFTGIAVIEFDKISFAKELKHEIFEKLKSCICAYISPSGFGVKFLIRIPVVSTVEEFKSYFYGLGFYFEHIAGWDGSAQNCILPLYLSWDEDLLYRENAEVWRFRGEKLNDWDKKPHIESTEQETTQEDKQYIINIVRKNINNIVDNGHLTVRSTSLALGGWCANSYIEYQEAEDLLFEIIENNAYLSKGIPGYKKTAKQMLNKGMEKPLMLERYDR